MTTRYVWKTGVGFVHPSTGEPMPMPEREGVCCPAVYGDIPEYLSPLGTGMITSRSQRRYEMEKHDCVEAPPRKKRGYRNARFAKKHGLPLNEEAR